MSLSRKKDYKLRLNAGASSLASCKTRVFVALIDRRGEAKPSRFTTPPSFRTAAARVIRPSYTQKPSYPAGPDEAARD